MKHLFVLLSALFSTFALADQGIDAVLKETIHSAIINNTNSYYRTEKSKLACGVVVRKYRKIDKDHYIVLASSRCMMVELLEDKIHEVSGHGVGTGYFKVSLSSPRNVEMGTNDKFQKASSWQVKARKTLKIPSHFYLNERDEVEKEYSREVHRVLGLPG